MKDKTNTITLDLFSTKASSTGKYVHIPLKPDAYTSTQQPFVQFTSISGRLTKGRYLARPIIVKIEEDDGEYMVSENKYYIHGEGPTVLDALDAFRRIFSGYLDILSEEEHNLSLYMAEQLAYLRSAIKME